MTYIASDHAGYQLKEQLKKYFDLEDLTPDYDPEDDYPIIAKQLAKKVVKTNNKGVLICGSGQGMVMAANKVFGARACLGYNNASVESSRKDEDANILCLPGRELTLRKAKELVKIFLNTKPSKAKRHVRRRNQLEL